jgi:hypothetical protein
MNRKLMYFTLIIYFSLANTSIRVKRALLGAKTLSIMILSTATFSLTTLSMMSLSIIVNKMRYSA